MAELIVRAVETAEEYLAGQALAARVFSQGNPESYERWMRNAPLLMGWPDFDLAWYRAGFIDGQMVAFDEVRPYRLRYGSVELRFGGIGMVCTDPEYRNRGCAAGLMHDSIAYMAARGDHLALLDGISNFYPRFGFSTLWPTTTLEFKAAEAAALEAALHARPATLDDVPQMAALYDRCWGGRVTIRRSDALWRWRMATLPLDNMRVVEDHAGTITGYLTGASRDDECVVETPAAARTLLAEVGRMTQAKDVESVLLRLPPDDPLIFYTRHWLPSTLHQFYHPSGHWMGRIIHGDTLCEALLPEITAQAGLDARGLIFDLQPETIYLGLRGQDTTNVQLEPGTFLQVLFGSLPIHALDLHPDAAHLLARLFPPRTAMIAPWDWF